MSLISKAEQTGKVNNFSVPHKGKVVNNKDPLKLGRVKCYVKGIYEDTSNEGESIPWAFPFYPLSAAGAGRPDAGFFGVPDVDSELIVVFPFKDIYSPFYVGYWGSQLNFISQLFTEDYPETWGITDSSCEFIRVNKKKPSIEFFRSKFGDCIKMDENGNWFINVPQNLIINVGNSIQVNAANNIVSSAGVNQTHYAAVDMNHGAGQNMGSAGGGGLRFNSTSMVHIRSSAEIALDGSAIHLNSGHASYQDSASGDLSALSGQVSSLQSTVQALQAEITQLKQLVAANKDKIGK